MSTQKMSLSQRLIVAIVLSSLLFGIGSLITNNSASHAQPIPNPVQQIAGPMSVQGHFYGPSPDANQYRYDKHTHQWYRYDNSRHGWYRYDRAHNRYY